MRHFSKFQFALSTSVTDLSVVAETFYTRSYKTYIHKNEIRTSSSRLKLTLLFSFKHSADESFKLFLYVSFEKGISQRINCWV